MINVNWASMIIGLASLIIQGLCNSITSWSKYWLPFYAKMVAIQLLLCFKRKRQRSINDFWSCMLDHPSAMQRDWHIITVFVALMGTMKVMIPRPSPKYDRQSSVNSFYAGFVSYTAINCIASFPNWVFDGESIQYVPVYNFTHMHAMSHKSDFVLKC